MAYQSPILILNVKSSLLNYHAYTQMIKGAIKSPQWYGVYTFRGIQYILQKCVAAIFQVLLVFSD